jgi:hypothetical protein
MLTLSEFDRKARGYHRRHVERWRHTRLLAASIYNAQRGPDDSEVLPEHIMKLPGDEATPATPLMSEEEYAAEFAAATALDTDLN